MYQMVRATISPDAESLFRLLDNAGGQIPGTDLRVVSREVMPDGRTWKVLLHGERPWNRINAYVTARDGHIEGYTVDVRWAAEDNPVSIAGVRQVQVQATAQPVDGQSGQVQVTPVEELPTIAEFARLRAEAAVLRQTVTDLQNAQRRYREQVREVALRVKADENWCDSGFNAAMEELGLDGISRDYNVEVSLDLRYSTTITVTATDEDDAEQQVNDMDDSDVLDNLGSSLYVSDMSLDSHEVLSVDEA